MYYWHEGMNLSQYMLTLGPSSSYIGHKQMIEKVKKEFPRLVVLKVSKSRKLVIYGVLNTSKKRTKLTILRIFFTQDSEFRSFFGRIEETVTCFRDCLTFTTDVFQSYTTRDLA